jgi:hypothetical protein
MNIIIDARESSMTMYTRHMRMRYIIISAQANKANYLNSLAPWEEGYQRILVNVFQHKHRKISRMILNE